MLDISLPYKIGAEDVDPVFLHGVIREIDTAEEISGLSSRRAGTVIRRSSTIAPASNLVNLDFSNVYFSQPSGITILSNLIHWLRQRGVQISYTGVNISFEAHKFLDDSDFFFICFDAKIDPTSSSRGTTKPLQLIERQLSHAWTMLEVLPWLKRITSINKRSLTDLSVCLKELINNIGDHSSERIGSTFAQFYPRNKTVVISISDFGIGIPERVRRFLASRGANQVFSDSWYIIKACERGFTTQSTIGNQGNGLAYLIDNVVNIYGGKVIILSGRAKVIILPGRTPIEIQNEWIYPGCLIDIHIPTDRIPIVEEDEEDFAW